MEFHEKEVLYSEYCNKCKYSKVPENDEPCEECLSNPTGFDSHKPLKFEEGAVNNVRKESE